jgi:hypothetical protein
VAGLNRVSGSCARLTIQIMPKEKVQVQAGLTRRQFRQELTAQPLQPGTFADGEPEFIRVPQVQQRAGIKRGLTYRRIKDGTFKSVLLREPGNKQGCRLVYWPSVKQYLHKLMAAQATTITTPEGVCASRNTEPQPATNAKP